LRRKQKNELRPDYDEKKEKKTAHADFLSIDFEVEVGDAFSSSSIKNNYL
jgi:hypothetical protein